MIIADLPVTTVFAILSVLGKSISTFSLKKRICYLLYLASRGRTAIFAFHKFAKIKIFSTHPTHSTIFHWQLHVWISCHISLERPWMGPLTQLLLDGQACAFRGQLSHCDNIARPPPVDELHSVIHGWFILGSRTWWAVSAQPQAPRAIFQAWTPNNHVLFMEARGKTRVGHSRHEWEKTGKRKEWLLWVIAGVFREVKAWFLRSSQRISGAWYSHSS